MTCAGVDAALVALALLDEELQALPPGAQERAAAALATAQAALVQHREEMASLRSRIAAATAMPTPAPRPAAIAIQRPALLMRTAFSPRSSHGAQDGCIGSPVNALTAASPSRSRSGNIAHASVGSASVLPGYLVMPEARAPGDEHRSQPPATRRLSGESYMGSAESSDGC